MELLEILPPDLILLIAFATPVIYGLVEAIKQMFSVKKDYIPLIAVVVGLFVGFAASPIIQMDMYLRLWAGGLAGLASTGLYEFTTKRNGKTKQVKK
jgi:hypothetical protein